METRLRRRGDDDVGANAGSTEPDKAANQTSAHSHLPATRKRAVKNSRGKNTDIESETESYDDDKCNHEMLQKRLKSVTDEKEIKRLKRLLRNRVSAQQARERKKRYINDLEQQLQEKDSELTSLKTKMQDVMTDNMTLRRLITTMRGASTATVTPHPAHSSCAHGQTLPPSPDKAIGAPSILPRDIQDHQGPTWHVSEVPQGED